MPNLFPPIKDGIASAKTETKYQSNTPPTSKQKALSLIRKNKGHNADSRSDSWGNTNSCLSLYSDFKISIILFLLPPPSTNHTLANLS